MAYLKPQSPIKNGKDNIYPLTTYDQIIMPDGSRWNGSLQKTVVNSINGNTGDVIITASDVGALASGETAINSSKLNGQAASYYATASALTALTERVATLEAIPNASGVSF